MTKLLTKKWFVLSALAAALVLAVFLVPASAQPEGGQMPERQLDMMTKMVGLVTDLSHVAESPSATGVMAVMSLDDRIADPSVQAKFLEGVLPDVKDPAVQRAIRVKLADDYKKAGQTEKALDQTKRLITGKVAE